MTDSSDPYAAARSRIFDTLKWLASTLGAIAGAMATGLALTALPTLQGPALGLAAGFGAAGLACLLGGIGVLIWVLLHPVVARQTVLEDAGLRPKVALLVPRNYSDLAAFETAHQTASETLRQAQAAEDALPGTATDAERTAARTRLNEAAGRLKPLEPAMGRIVSYGSLLILRRRAGQALILLGLLTLAGIICLSVVAYQIGAAKPAAPVRSLTIELR